MSGEYPAVSHIILLLCLTFVTISYRSFLGTPAIVLSAYTQVVEINITAFLPQSRII